LREISSDHDEEINCKKNTHCTEDNFFNSSKGNIFYIVTQRNDTVLVQKDVLSETICFEDECTHNESFKLEFTVVIVMIKVFGSVGDEQDNQINQNQKSNNGNELELINIRKRNRSEHDNECNSEKQIFEQTVCKT
jgi:hypothetical protein